jgi:hypothetical protein
MVKEVRELQYAHVVKAEIDEELIYFEGLYSLNLHLHSIDKHLNAHS